MPLSRRSFLTLLGSFACTPLLSGCLIPAKPITVATHLWPGYIPLTLANDMGWLDTQQVKLLHAETFTDSIQLIEQGKIDAAGLTLDEVLRIRENGIALAVILICDVSAGADMLLAKPSINTLAELKGKRIGVEDGALGALMKYEILQAAGLKAEEVQFVPLTTDLQIKAWHHNQIDAAITYEPTATHLHHEGGQSIFDSRQAPDLIYDVIAVHPNALDDAHADALHHLVAAHLKALAHINSNPDDAAYRMAAHFGLAADQVMTAFKGLLLPDLDNNYRMLKTTPPPLLQSAAVVAEVIGKAGVLHHPADLHELIRAEYLPEQES